MRGNTQSSKVVSSHFSACGASSLSQNDAIDSRSASCSSVKAKWRRLELKSGLRTLSTVAMKWTVALSTSCYPVAGGHWSAVHLLPKYPPDACAPRVRLVRLLRRGRFDRACGPARGVRRALRGRLFLRRIRLPRGSDGPAGAQWHPDRSAAVRVVARRAHARSLRLVGLRRLRGRRRDRRVADPAGADGAA